VSSRAGASRRLKPNEELSLEQAVKEVSAAVETAIDVISKGERGSNLDDLVNAVLARIAEKTGAGDIEGAAREADRGFAEWERVEAERRDWARPRTPAYTDASPRGARGRDDEA
jgi:acyl-CoA reductase-like NAD-dependent aldehyde dehydrogenase